MELSKARLEAIRAEAERDLVEAQQRGNLADVREARFYLRSVDRRLAQMDFNDGQRRRREDELAQLGPRELAARILRR